MKRLFTMVRKTRKGAETRPSQTFPAFRTDSERRLRWLLSFALESSEPRTPAESRTVHAQVGAYLGGLLIRQKGEDVDGPRVMELGDSRMPDALPMRGADNRKPLEAKLALIRMDVRRVVTAFLRAPTAFFRVTGEITWQRILEKHLLGPPTFRVQGVAADVREGITFRLLEDLEPRPARSCGNVPRRAVARSLCGATARNSARKLAATAPTFAFGMSGREERGRARSWPRPPRGGNGPRTGGGRVSWGTRRGA